MIRAIALRRVSALHVAFAGVAAVAAPAAAQTHWSVDTSASAGISTNPYLTTGPTSASATGTLDLRPTLSVQRPLTTINIIGDANLAFYSQNRSTNETFSLTGTLEQKLSTRTSFNASVSYLNSIVGGFNDIRVPVGGAVVETGLPVLVNDPTVGAIGNRRESYQASAGLRTEFSPRDRASLDLSASASRYGGLAFGDFNYLAPRASYSRAVGDGFDVGASMSVGFTDYLGTRVGDARVYQPQATVSRRISRSLTVDLAAGAGIATVRNANGVDTTSTSFNGSATLCRRDERWNACASASRQTVPSAYQGVRTQTTIGLSGGYRMSERNDLSFSGNYSHSGDPVQQVVIGGARSGSLDYLSANANLSHRFARAFSGFVTTGVNTAFGDGIRRNANFTALVGLSYRFGGR